MTLLSTIFPDIPNLTGVKWLKQGGSPFNHVVPANSKWCRASVRAAGGYGDNLGGGAAYARKRFTVTPGENLVIQVGATSTQTILGDSWVKRNDGALLAYADRGRGSGAGGLDSISTGDIKRSGVAGASGATPGDDTPDSDPVLGPSTGVTASGVSSGLPMPIGPGGGGKIYYGDDVEGSLIRVGYPGGQGLVCLEFFDADPGL